MKSKLYHGRHGFPVGSCGADQLNGEKQNKLFSDKKALQLETWLTGYDDDIWSSRVFYSVKG